jgi:hypothetical protein
VLNVSIQRDVPRTRELRALKADQRGRVPIPSSLTFHARTRARDERYAEKEARAATGANVSICRDSYILPRVDSAEMANIPGAQHYISEVSTAQARRAASSRTNPSRRDGA